MEILLEEADECLLDSDGEPVAWPVALGGDKGYRVNWMGEYLIDLSI